jgi:hypothetical protein
MRLRPEDGLNLTRQWAAHASAEQRRRFVQALAPQAAAAHSAAARAVATVVATLEGPDVDDAMRRLGRAGVDAMVRESVAYTAARGLGDWLNHGIDGAQLAQADATLHTALANAVGSGSDPLLKAWFTAASGALFSDIASLPYGDPESLDAALGDVAAGMSNAMLTNPTSVVEHLFLLDSDGAGASNGRRALAGWVGVLMDVGGERATAVGVILESLRRGNDLSADPGAYLAREEVRPGVNGPYLYRAATLGRYLSVVGGEIDDRAAQRDRSYASTALMFSFGVDFLMETAGVMFPAAKYPIAVAKSAVKRLATNTLMGMRSEAMREERGFMQAMFNCALYDDQGNRLQGPAELTILAYSGGGVRER